MALAVSRRASSNGWQRAPAAHGQRPVSAQALWDLMAEELVGLIAEHLEPHAKTESVPRPLPSPTAVPHPSPREFANSSRGAAHWVSLSKFLKQSAPFKTALSRNRRSYRETLACERVLASHNEDVYDWPLEVLKLRGADDSSEALSHFAPFARTTLKAAYWSVAKEVHPDRLQVGSDLATQAMSVLNEVCARARVILLSPATSPSTRSSFLTAAFPLTAALRLAGVPSCLASFCRA